MTSLLLPSAPSVSPALQSQVSRDYERFARSGLPVPIEEYLAEQYRLDLHTQYAQRDISNPWGKASGQLSMTARQVAEDVEAGLGFVVLKTVIAQDASGTQSMHEWAVPESRMETRRIVGESGESGESGWTIDWKGRGWWRSFDDYLQLIRDAQQVARGTGTLIVPSCKYHLPSLGENTWNESEYEYTTCRMLQAWRKHAESAEEPMPLEKDFSPTLAGSDRALLKSKILEWLRRVPRMIRNSVKLQENSTGGQGASEADSCAPQIRVGLKLFNALFDDEFQLEMLKTVHEPGISRPDYYVYANRLFDPNRTFEGRSGIAYGGPDLSDRNLRVLSRFHVKRSSMNEWLPWSATGNICTGKMALEYALRGAGSFQMHTVFQLPSDVYSMNGGNKTQKALHELYFHPKTGFVVWLLHVAGTLDLPHEVIRFRDVVGRMDRSAHT